MRRVQAQLDLIAAARCKELCATQETKAFIAGDIEPGGGPSHYDSYDNLALVLTGHKIFYHATPEALERVDMCGKQNERLGANPFDNLAFNSPVYKLHTHNASGVALAGVWKVAVLEAGDILFLPHRWWHSWVWSEPHTIMTNKR
jgi:hypothetical protein